MIFLETLELTHKSVVSRSQLFHFYQDEVAYQTLTWKVVSFASGALFSLHK